MCADDSLPENNPAVPSCGHSSKVSVPNPGTMTDGAALLATGARLDPDPAAEAHALGIGWRPDARLQSADHEPVLVSASGDPAASEVRRSRGGGKLVRRG